MKDIYDAPDARSGERSDIFDKQAEAVTLNRRNARRLAKKLAHKTQKRKP